MPMTIDHHPRSLYGDPLPVGRRAFLVTSLGAGFALAARPISAQTITTSSEGVTAGEVKVRVRDGEIVTYPDAPHGFLADYRPSYRMQPSEDGWKRMLAWFKRYGVA